MKNKYTITMNELIARPIIRSDRPFEYMNKMSDIEIDQFILERYDENYDDIDETARVIDMNILYELFKLADKKHEENI